MTFRGRLVLATTAAVLVVVILGSIATYLVAYNSLVGSVDVTLAGQAAGLHHRSVDRRPSSTPVAPPPGPASRWCLPDGTTNRPDGPAVLPDHPDRPLGGRQPGPGADTAYFSHHRRRRRCPRGGGRPAPWLRPTEAGVNCRGSSAERRCTPAHHAPDRRQPGAPPPGLRPVDHRHRSAWPSPSSSAWPSDAPRSAPSTV